MFTTVSRTVTSGLDQLAGGEAAEAGGLRDCGDPTGSYVEVRDSEGT